MDKYILSIVVPVYNCQNIIKRTIDSITKQLTKDCELIIVNDGSTDNSLDVIKQCTTNVKNIKIVNKNNEGLINARKTGLEQCSGDYYWAVDGGDIIVDDAIVTVLKEINNKRHDIYICDYFSKDHNGVVTNHAKLTGNALKDLLLGNMNPCIWSKIVKKNLLYKSWNSESKKIIIAEDLYASCDVLSQTNDVVLINKPLYMYILEENSITTGGKRDLGYIHTINMCIDAIKNNTNFNDYKNEVEYLIYNQLIINCVYKRRNKNYVGKFLKAYKSYKISPIKNNYIGYRGILVLLAEIEKILPFKNTLLSIFFNKL